MLNLIKKFKGFIVISAVALTLLVNGYVQTKNVEKVNLQNSISKTQDKKVPNPFTNTVKKTENKPITLEELNKITNKYKTEKKVITKKHYNKYYYYDTKAYYTNKYNSGKNYQSVLKDLKPKHSNYYDNNKSNNYNYKDNGNNSNSYKSSNYTYIPKSSSDVYVHGYYKKNGTYVEPYYRTKADKTTKNNFSHYNNVNPYTGKVGKSRK